MIGHGILSIMQAEPNRVGNQGWKARYCSVGQILDMASFGVLYVRGRLNT